MDEVLAVLDKWGEEARIVAGNTTLYELANQGGLAGTRRLVDLEGAGLNYIRVDEQGTLHLGACTTFSEIASSELLDGKSYFGIKEVSVKTTPPQIRNMGTIGGSACSGIPFYDIPVVLHALRARMEILSLNSQRIIEGPDFFVDYFVTALQPNEVLAEIQVDSRPLAGSSFVKLGRSSVDFAVVNCSTFVSLDGNGRRVLEARISLGGVSNTPISYAAAEEYLVGKEASEASVVAAATKPLDFEPMPSVHASTAYKKRVIPVVVRDALLLALERARQARPR